LSLFTKEQANSRMYMFFGTNKQMGKQDLIRDKLGLIAHTHINSAARFVNDNRVGIATIPCKV